MALLVGRHANKVDQKARVSVPKPFRASLFGASDDAKSRTVYLFPSFKYAAVEGCAEGFMERLAGSLEDMDLFSDDQDDLAAVILESATALTPDPEGRITLPAELMEHAGLKKGEEALFVGRGAQFRIWNPAAYAAQAQTQLDRAKARGATLKLSGGRDDG
ncbi:MAG: division/cell wall cluster transcriptional repressor MraZ [Magnetovibrionaceae bacterium]